MKLSALAAAIQATHSGDDVEIDRVSSIPDAGPSSLVFALTPALFAEAQSSAACAILVASSPLNTKPLLIHSQPKLAFARAARLLGGEQPWEGIHSTAIVAASVRMAARVSIGAYAVIGEGASIGEGSRIGAHTVVAPNVLLGKDCTVHPNVTIYGGTSIGDRVIIHAGAVLGSDGFGYIQDKESGRYEPFPQLGRLILEDDVEIGANAALDRGALGDTIVKRGAKIDNLVHIAHNVTVGEDVVIAAQTGISGSSQIADGVVIAGQVGIADHVRIEEGVILGAQSGVPSGKVVRGKGIVFWGTPARPIKDYLKQLAVLAKMGKKNL